MQRNCIIIASSVKFPRHICVDQEIYEEFLAFVEKDARHKQKYKQITDHILNEHNLYFELYQREGNNKKTNAVAAMKFFKQGDNARVYCREMSGPNGQFFVIAAKLLAKKTSQKNDKAIISLVKTISDYEYVIIG